MKLWLSSDIHIKEENDSGHEYLRKLVYHQSVQDEDELFLLGDIFDLFISHHQYFYEKYRYVFDDLVKSKFKRIHFIEGNHDLHIEKMNDLFLRRNEKRFVFHKDPIIFHFAGERILLCHGDEKELENFPNKVWRGFLRSKIARFIIDRFFSGKSLDGLGMYLSEKSRGHKKRNSFNEYEESNRERFRSSAFRFLDEEYSETLVCGHYHSKDYFENEQKVYLNNGFAPKTGTAILISPSGKKEFVEL